MGKRGRDKGTKMFGKQAGDAKLERFWGAPQNTNKDVMSISRILQERKERGKGQERNGWKRKKSRRGLQKHTV